MTDDIVTRLRETFDKKLGDFRDLLVAADEIEELRKDLSLQARCISRHYDQFADLRNEIERLREELAEAHHAIGVYRKMAGIQPTITKFGDE